MLLIMIGWTILTIIGCVLTILEFGNISYSLRYSKKTYWAITGIMIIFIVALLSFTNFSFLAIGLEGLVLFITNRIYFTIHKKAI